MVIGVKSFIFPYFLPGPNKCEKCQRNILRIRRMSKSDIIATEELKTKEV